MLLLSECPEPIVAPGHEARYLVLAVEGTVKRCPRATKMRGSCRKEASLILRR